ncbi:hypothetical protein CYMTET_33215, partial [Cymbomonas tetramitiformis]
PGLDYTVAHHGQMSESEWLDISLCFVNSRGKANAEAWGTGEVGGYECWIGADSESDAASAVVYKGDQAGCIIPHLCQR